MPKTAYEKHAAALSKIEADRQALAERQAKLVRREADERRAAVLADPDRRSDTGGVVSAVGKVVRELADVEKKLAGLDAEISARRLILAELEEEAKRERREQLLADFESEISALDTEEAKMFDGFVAWMRTGFESWLELVSLYERRRAIPFQFDVDGDESLLAFFKASARPHVQPQARDFVSLFELLWTVITDPDGSRRSYGEIIRAPELVPDEGGFVPPNDLRYQPKAIKVAAPKLKVAGHSIVNPAEIDEDLASMNVTCAPVHGSDSLATGVAQSGKPWTPAKAGA